MASTESTFGKIDASTRMFGMPHQLLAHNDPRLGTGSDLGKTFAETMILEAPIVAIKPGVSEFLPGKNQEDKNGFITEFIDSARSNSARNSLKKMADDDGDNLRWFDHKPAYSDYMIGVNMICRAMAVLYGVDKIKVPWVSGNTTFGYYDWRYYRMGKMYESSSKVKSGNTKDGQGWVSKVGGIISKLKSAVEDDDQYVEFYVDANASFSESASNQTTQSALSAFVDKVEGLSKELGSIGAMIGDDWENAVDSLGDTVDSTIQTTVDSLLPSTGILGGLGNLTKRLSSGAKQILRGGNFVLPEHFSDASYGKNYSFSLTLTTPYGTKLAHYLNIGVPMAHVLGLFLPVQMSANTFKSPYLLKVFSPGWFNASLAIGDSLGISKGGDGGWAANGLPNEVKLDMSVKDLYSNLYIPQSTNDFVQNSGMIEFLMVNCGVDITNQDLFLSSQIWINLLAGNVSDRVTAAPFQVKYAVVNSIRNRFNLLR